MKKWYTLKRIGETLCADWEYQVYHLILLEKKVKKPETALLLTEQFGTKMWPKAGFSIEQVNMY